MKLSLTPSRSRGKILKFLLVGSPLALCTLLGFQNAQEAAGWVAYKQGRYSEAYDHYAAAGDERGMGIALVALHQPLEAFECFTNAGDVRGQGLALLENREPWKALVYFRTAGDPSGEGLALLALNRAAEARQVFANAGDWVGLGMVALHQWDTQEAVGSFLRSGNLSGVGLAWLREKDYAKAEAAFVQAGDLRGLALIALTRHDFARAEVLSVQARDWSAAGASCMARNEFAKAEAYFKAANDHNGLGDLYARFDNWEEARQAFTKGNDPIKVLQAFRRDNFDPNAMKNGLAFVEQTLAGQNYPAAFLIEAADLYYDLGDSGKAFGLLNSAGALPGMASRVNLRRGRLNYWSGDIIQARANFQAVVRAETSSEEEAEAARECQDTLLIPQSQRR
ncbi:MAG: tetratricopeptide repeat protein [Verrucomicrobiales bacterium]